MIAAALAAAVLHLAQPVEPPCAPAGLGVGAGGAVVSGEQPVSGPVDRGSVVDFLVSVYNNGPEVYSGIALSLEIESGQRVARLDGMRVEVSEDGGPWRPLEASAGPDFAFTAPLAEFPLPVAVSRNFQIRMHLDPAQPGSLRPEVRLAISADCALRAGFPLEVRRSAPAAEPPDRSLPLLLGVIAGALAALLGYSLWVRRQPVREARRARS